MIFSTNLFLFVFLPLFLTVYYLLPMRARSAWILLASYVFYGWWRVDFLALFFLTTLWTFLFGTVIARSRGVNAHRAAWALAIGVTGDLGTLAYFKYFNFGIDSFNAILSDLGTRPITAWQVVLPIGISFYVFQAVSYLIDVYRGDAPQARDFWDLSAFIALFPQLIAGPILRYKDVGAQFRERTHTFAKFSEGSLRFMVGFCKKVLIADSIAPLADSVFALDAPTAADAWLGTIAYSLQLYFDFSGYSDMAIGLGLMIGFRFRENFNHPYISRSITEFWRRWHISLSSWLRDYLYFPLGGNRKGIRRTYANLMTVMLLGGLWHGANWTFVIWGAWHGVFLASERAVGGAKDQVRSSSMFAVPRTLLIVVLGWVVFRAVDVSSAVAVYRGMLGLNGFSISDSLDWQIKGLHLAVMASGVVLVFLAPWWRGLLNNISVAPSRSLAQVHLAIVPLFVLAILRLSAQGFSPFLYFQF